ncbi:MAG: nucleotidyltransferase domain-containing protein, partial [Azonexus sp.]
MSVDLAALRSEVKAGQQALRESYALTNDAQDLLRTRCRQVDGVLIRLWAGLDFPATLTLAAVGGYGRGELYPASDIDLLILLPHEPDTALQEGLERLVGHFWDIGLEIGHSVRTVQDCLDEAAGDISVQTALVEARLLTGNENLFATFQKRLRGNLDPLLFYERKRLEQQERHLRFNETPYSLEPNFKEAPGGLRDLQVIFWVARAAGFGTTWADLEKNGFLSAEELKHVERCEEYLRHLRIRLHLMVGRREDRLLFDYQNTLAAQYGFESTPGKRASERLMQGYYRNAKAITLTNTILMQNIGAALAPENEQLPHPIDANFQSVGGLLDICNENAFNLDPALILGSFLVMQEHSDLHGMTARTLRALWRSRELITPAFRTKPAHRAIFVKLLQGSRGVIH